MEGLKEKFLSTYSSFNSSYQAVQPLDITTWCCHLQSSCLKNIQPNLIEPPLPRLVAKNKPFSPLTKKKFLFVIHRGNHRKFHNISCFQLCVGQMYSYPHLHATACGQGRTWQNSDENDIHQTLEKQNAHLTSPLNATLSNTFNTFVYIFCLFKHSIVHVKII